MYIINNYNSIYHKLCVANFSCKINLIIKRQMSIKRLFRKISTFKKRAEFGRLAIYTIYCRIKRCNMI